MTFDFETLVRAASPSPPRATAAAARSHLVLIPSYDSGPKLVETVRAARRYWAPVWVVVDGSTDGSELAVRQLAAADPDIRVMALAENRGKGAAILHGLHAAAAAGFSHVLTMDADGQHPAPLIPEFIAASRADPQALILGRPVFDASAPRIRVLGRRLSNWWTNVETLWAGSFDSLFGFRVYPVDGLIRVMEASRWMRRFDFDAEAAVRLCWAGYRPVSRPAPVRYFTPGEGGVSHFRYGRDNVLLTGMHLRLIGGFLVRLPALALARFRSSRR